MDNRNNIFSWVWNDREIDHNNFLLTKIENIVEQGFYCVLIYPGFLKYKFTDSKVLRAISKASNYAAKRDLKFWVLVDPRKASRFFLSNTEERTQCLITHPVKKDNNNFGFSNISKLKNGRFSITIPFSDKYLCPNIQEKAVQFSFSGIERVFLFRMDDGIIDFFSVADITGLSYSYTNIADGTINITGDITDNPAENYYAMAFPRFDTNLYDFAGRASNDLVYDFANNIFDSCTHLDGMLWSTDETSYGMMRDILPVSISIYNSFKAEHRYDLRDFLYALLLPVDNNSHIKIRTDYFSHLDDLIKESKKDFHSTMHAFFPDMQLISRYSISRGAGSDNKSNPVFNPWIKGNIVSTYLTKLHTQPDNNNPDPIAGIIMSKSLSLFSNLQSAAIEIESEKPDAGYLNYIADLASIFSIDLVFSESLCSGKFISEINSKMADIAKITRKMVTFSDTLFIFPTHTLMNLNQKYRNYVLNSTFQLIKDLTLAHIQIDVIHPHILQNAIVSDKGIEINNKIYKAVIAPYAEIVDSEIFHILSQIDDYKHPLLFGNSAPKYSTIGKKVPGKFSTCFTIGENHIQEILSCSVKPAASFPESSIGTIIFNIDNTLVLASPSSPGSKFEGQILFDGYEIPVEKSSSIVIFEKQAAQGFTKIL